MTAKTLRGVRTVVEISGFKEFMTRQRLLLGRRMVAEAALAGGGGGSAG
jgi:hypothetical protein